MSNQNRLPLLLVSFAALFFEVLVIRWVATEITVFGYFKNLILMGAFVGMGLGCATAGRVQADDGGAGNKGLAPWFPVLFLILSGIIASSPLLGLTHINFVLQDNVHFWLHKSDVMTSVQQLMGNTAWVVLIFSLVVVVFDSLGQLLGRELAKHESLRSYTVNLAGSAAGVLVYSLLAFLQTPPAAWLLVGFASILPFYKKSWQVAAMVACIGIAVWSSGDSAWSPYYRFELTPDMTKAVPGEPSYRLGTSITVNHAPAYQRTIDLSDAFIAQHPILKTSPEYIGYNMPYRICPTPKNVLVLGAGSGNDVAAALRHGAKHVDAVEIDPKILSLGKTDHPELPYRNPAVTTYVNDARNFISRNDKKYDLIVFGFVDSFVSFSMLSSVRLDNFLYTVESLKRATASLSNDGVACLSFAAGAPWLCDRLYQMVQTASGETPIAVKNSTVDNHSIIVLWGPGLTGQRREQFLRDSSDLVIPSSQLMAPVRLCTDDWPFIYQKEPALSSAYGIMLSLLILIAGSLTVMRFRLQPKSFMHYFQFFFLGAGFLLLETRGMLAIAVLFGSTWLVNSLVIFLILLMALAANKVVERYRKINANAAYAALLASLVVLYMVPLSTLAGTDLPMRILGASALIGSPFVCAGLVFSSAFAKVAQPEKALGINILGALLGGCLEYLSVVIGTRDLVLIALALYVISLIAAYLIKPGTSSSGPQIESRA